MRPIRFIRKRMVFLVVIELIRTIDPSLRINDASNCTSFSTDIQLLEALKNTETNYSPPLNAHIYNFTRL